MTSTPTPPGKPVRRRASRPAGPTAGKAPEVTAVSVPTAEAVSATTARKVVKPVVPPSRRSAPSRLVTIVALACGLVATAIVGAAVAVLIVQENNAEEAQARDQRFVDTATQVVVNMFSFKPDSIDDSVDQFYNSTSGPLRDMFSQNNNVENLKAIFRQTGGSSETVINGAALESFDDVSNNATVLVSARVTASDMNGNNRPSQPYRLRIVVHEDDDGRMTAYDLNYPNGGN